MAAISPSRAKPLESDLQRALLARAAVTFRHVRLFRRNVGLMSIATDSSPRMFRAGIKGQSDLYALMRGGGHGEIELKRYGKLSPEQCAWRDWCGAWAIPWILLEARRGESPTETIDRWIAELHVWLDASLGKGANAAGASASR